VLRFAKDTKRHFHFFILIVVVLVIHCSGRGACWRGLVRDLGLVVIIIQGGDTEAAKLLGAGLHYRRRRGGGRSVAAAKRSLPRWFGAKKTLPPPNTVRLAIWVDRAQTWGDRAQTNGKRRARVTPAWFGRFCTNGYRYRCYRIPPQNPSFRRRRRDRLTPSLRRRDDHPPRANHGARCGSHTGPAHLLQPQRGLPRALFWGRPHQGMEPGNSRSSPSSLPLKLWAYLTRSLCRSRRYGTPCGAGCRPSLPTSRQWRRARSRSLNRSAATSPSITPA